MQNKFSDIVDCVFFSSLFFPVRLLTDASWLLCQLQWETPLEIDLPTESRTKWQTGKRQPPSNENSTNMFQVSVKHCYYVQSRSLIPGLQDILRKHNFTPFSCFYFVGVLLLCSFFSVLGFINLMTPKILVRQISPVILFIIILITSQTSSQRCNDFFHWIHKLSNINILPKGSFLSNFWLPYRHHYRE